MKEEIENQLNFCKIPACVNIVRKTSENQPEIPASISHIYLKSVTTKFNFFILIIFLVQNRTAQFQTK